MSVKTTCVLSVVGVTLLGVCGAHTGVLAASADMPNCSVAALAALDVPDVTIMSAAVVPASAQNPEYCDVIGAVTTRGAGAGPGEARFHAQLPAAWNHKYLATGPGGVSGNFFPSMNPLDVATSIRKGYAFVTNDTGHQSAFFDAGWALTAPHVPDKPKLVDWFYRAQHQVAVATKALVTAFYAEGPVEYSYFDGCSNAGRNALIEAARYPDDYDGIIAGAPYVDQRGNQLWGYKNAKAFLDRDAFIQPSTLPVIDAAVKASCDGADGVVDGLIQNPAACSFDPDELVPATLTQAQANAIKIFIRAVRDEHRRVIYPGSSISDLSDASGFGGFIPWTERGPAIDPTSPQPWGAQPPLTWQAADTVIRHMVVRDPDFNATLDWPETDGIVSRDAVELFDRRTSVGDANVAHDLVPYLRDGKKVILYHGYDDQAITPYRTVWFYQDLAQIFGGYQKTQHHARLFMVPGMQHCGGGAGPNSVDTLTALEQWVERGIAPDGLVATKFVNDNPAQGVARTMPLCKFPEMARYRGAGDIDDAASWRCSSRDASLLHVGRNGHAAGLDDREPRARSRE